MGEEADTEAVVGNKDIRLPCIGDRPGEVEGSERASSVDENARNEDENIYIFFVFVRVPTCASSVVVAQALYQVQQCLAKSSFDICSYTPQFGHESVLDESREFLVTRWCTSKSIQKYSGFKQRHNTRQNAQLQFEEITRKPLQRDAFAFLAVSK